MTNPESPSRDERFDRAVAIELERRTIQHRFRTPGIGRRLADIGLEYDRLVASIADELRIDLDTVHTSVLLVADKRLAR